MLSRVLVAGLAVVVLGGLAGAAALAQEPSPPPAATGWAATPTPVVTPVGCGFFAYTPTPGATPLPNPTTPGSPAVPTDLRAELVDDPQLASGSAVLLTWQDNADNETCFGVAVRIDGEHAGVIGLSPGLDGTTTGPMSTRDFPGQTGLHCYQVYYGNAAGQSHSNEVCINVEEVAVRLEPTPPPPGCQGEGPIGAPGTPNPPANLRAELVLGSGQGEGLMVRLTWEDNATDDLCYTVEQTAGPGSPGARYVFGHGRPPAETGVMTEEEIPWQVATYCYRVQFGNEAGRSPYSNEACVDVEALPVWKTATPAPPVASMTPVTGARPQWPPACDGKGPVGVPGSPSPPTNLQAELVTDSTVLEGFVVRLEWYDNADNEACSVIERKIGEGEWALQSGSGPSDPWDTGPVFVNDVPQQVGIHCYRIFYGNDAGRSAYSNEACVEVEVLPKILAPTPAPWPCSPPETPPYSELGPNAPTNLQAIFVWDTAAGGGLRVDLAWEDNATGELCWGFERRGIDGVWQWIGGGSGDATTAVDGQPFLGDGCYRTWVANEHGRSAYSNEACATGAAVTVTPTPITTPTPSAPVTPVAVPITGGAREEAGLAWWWWALAAAGSAALGLSVVGLAAAARRRR